MSYLLLCSLAYLVFILLLIIPLLKFKYINDAKDEINKNDAKTFKKPIQKKVKSYYNEEKNTYFDGSTDNDNDYYPNWTKLSNKKKWKEVEKNTDLGDLKTRLINTMGSFAGFAFFLGIVISIIILGLKLNRWLKAFYILLYLGILALMSILNFKQLERN